MKKAIKIIITLVALLLAAVIFYFLLRSFSWPEAYASIKILKWTTLIIFIFCILAISFIKATRFFIILRSGDVQASFVKTVAVFISSQAFTPLPGGEIVRALIFKNRLHLEAEQIGAPVFLQAIIELWTAAFLATASVFFIKTSFGSWLAIGLIIMLAVLTMAILIPNRLSKIIFFLKSKGIKYEWLSKFGRILEATKQFIIKEDGQWRSRLWIKLISLGLTSQGVAVFLIWYIAGTQGVGLSLFQSMFTVGIAVLIQSILFIIPGGLGVTEGGLIGVLATFGVRWNKAVIITLLYRASMLPLLIVIALLFLLFSYTPKILKIKENKYV